MQYLFAQMSWAAWSVKVLAPFGVVVTGAMEALARIVDLYVEATIDTKAKPRLPHNPKMHLDELESTDRLYIGINKCLTVVFVYHLAQLVWTSPGVLWAPQKATVMNTVGALAAFFLLYDLVYATFHRALHMRWCYKFCHKHHHRQISPTRGNYDAINVHPFEFLVGEYVHLLAIYLIPCHITAVACFILSGGVLASLNHTRLGLKFPLYDVRNHDVHHRWPEVNFGQYTMIWDKAFGWFKPYDAPKVGKDY
ncbi:hypothetical protein M885DRAFT_532412 [Pelagophyceae sp. CCMP2097]|nr:hypothetical protein M885DRAFT_532412 [Pelagophyceae sp. CCMP2097]|mmetsp:Transcript_31272/g.105221  ORF Transcript_31272/g.105221 Transcript_31272/m.105221 type:complete len:252 (+) Transcript_31272:84-839(+)